MPGRAIRQLRSHALLVLIALACACRTRPNDCSHESTERCLWEAGVASPATANSDGDANGGPTQLDDFTEQATQLDATLTEMISIIAAGLEWSLVDAHARALCTETPDDPNSPGVRDDPGSPGSPDESPKEADRPGDGKVRPKPAPSPGKDVDAWTCAIGELSFAEQPLALEASMGVLSLSAADIGDSESAELFELAQQRFDGWCAAQTLEEFEGEGLAEFYRCSLPDGPYLVIARFPRDLEAGLWQVSIAIVDAG